VTIDATGEALIAHAAGCETRYGREAHEEYGEPFTPDEPDEKVQPCTWMYISHRVRPGPPFDMRKLERNSALESNLGWFRDYPEECMKLNSGIYLHWGCSIDCPDTRDPAAVADTQRRAYELIRGDLDILRSNGYGVYLAPKIGVRESRRLVGEYVLNACDLKAGALPEDTIAVSRYWLDAWGENLSSEDVTVPLYGIPYRCLLPKDTDGLLVAGKAISGTRLACSSYRVQPSVAGIGEAAGTAAALAVSGGHSLHDVSAKQLREKLLASGALPESYDEVREVPKFPRATI
jgi:hypothetical protein